MGNIVLPLDVLVVGLYQFLDIRAGIRSRPVVGPIAAGGRFEL